jgi:ubiquinone biosynthesis protein
LFETARRFDMQIQPQLILLQKTLLNVEGLGRQLYPELDLWKTAQPVLKQWMRERMSPRTVLKRIRAQLPDTIEGLKELPGLFQTAAREASEGRFRLQIENRGLAELRRELEQANRRRDLALAAAALWLSGAVWLAAAAPYRWFAWAQMAAAAVFLLMHRTSKWQAK